MTPQRWRRDPAALLVAVVCAVFVALAVGPSLVGARVFASADLALQYAPWSATQPAGAKPDNGCVSDPVDGFLPAAAEFRRELLHGDIAQWDNLASGGAPLAAAPSFATYSPLSLPLLALPTWLAPAWMKLLEMVVSTGGVFLFLRRLNLARAPALLGGLVFTTSGFMVTWTNWPHTRTAAFVPVLLWSLERLIQLRTARAVVPVAVSVAAMLLGGFPEVTGFALYLAAPYVLFRVLTTRQEVVAKVRSVTLAGVGVALGVLLVAFQLLPFASQLSGLDLAARAQTSRQHLPLLSLVTTALPKAFGSCPGRDYVGPANDIEANAFIGSAVLVLVVVGLLRRRRPQTPAGVRGFFVVAVLVTVALGWVGGPLLALAQHLPVFHNNPVPRIRVILGLCLAILAAFGYDALLRARAEQRPQRRWVEPMVWLVLAAGSVPVLIRLRNNLRPTGHLAVSDRQTLYAAVAALIALAAVVLARSRVHRLAIGAIPVVVLAQALNVVLPFWPQIPRHDFYPRTPVHDYLAAHLGGERFQGTGLTMLPGTNVYYGLRSLGGHSFTASTWRQLMQVADPEAFRTTSFSTLSPSLLTATSPALDRFAVKYLVVSPEVQPFGTVVSPGVATGTVALPPGGYLDVAVTGALRGVDLPVTDVTGADGDVTVQVLSKGSVVASSGRRLLPTSRPGELPVALAGENLPTGPLVLRLGNATSVPLGLAAVGGVPAVRLVRPAADGLRVAEASVSGTVWERTHVLDRVRWASRVSLAAQGPASLKVAGITPAVNGQVVLASNPAKAIGGAGTVRTVHDGPDALEVRVQSKGSGYVVVADGLQASWQATVDGRAVPLLDADHALVAVPVSAGTHVVRLRYVPKGLRPGLVLSGLGVLVLLGLALRRGPAPQPVAGPA